MGWKVFSFEYFLDRYAEAGVRVIPIEGMRLSDGTFDPKAAGYPGWETYVATRQHLLQHISWKWRWGGICGPGSKGLLVLDYDLEDEFGSREEARRWRELHKWALRDIETPVVFTPSGGVHVWFSAPDGVPEPGRIDRITYGCFPCGPDLTKWSGQVLIPPSRLIDKGYYVFMDQDTVLPNLAKSLRVLK